MTHRSLISFLAPLLLAAGCSSSSDTPSTATDTGVVPASDTASDVLANTCTPAGGSCVALTATSKCPEGTTTSSDPAIHCEGVGAMCCVPGGADAGSDGTSDVADSGNECVANGGECIALTATSKCPTGKHSSSRACGGVGAMCCETDAATDGGGE